MTTTLDNDYYYAQACFLPSWSRQDVFIIIYTHGSRDRYLTNYMKLEQMQVFALLRLGVRSVISRGIFEAKGYRACSSKKSVFCCVSSEGSRSLARAGVCSFKFLKSLCSIFKSFGDLFLPLFFAGTRSSVNRESRIPRRVPAYGNWGSKRKSAYLVTLINKVRDFTSEITRINARSCAPLETCKFLCVESSKSII